MQRGRLALLLSLAFLLLHVRGQDDFNLDDALDVDDFNLDDALDVDDFNLEDALDVGATNRPDSVTEKADSDDQKPQPGSKDNTGSSFKDEDLIDDKNPPPKKRGGDPKPTSAGDTEASQGLIPGVISAVLVTVVGAVSSFIAYQKKKLCFKASGNEETVNMESQQGAHAEPPVQQTLLQK